MIKIQLLFLALCFISCDQKNPYAEKIETNRTKNVFHKTKTVSFDFGHHDGSTNLKSKLKEKSLRLKNIQNKYIITSIGQIKKHTSIVLKGIISKPKVCYSTLCYKINNTDNLSNSIHSINYASVQGKKRHIEYTSLKADIEELVFHSEEDAKSLFSYIRHARSIEYFWNSLDKGPCKMFREKTSYISLE